MDPLDDLLRPRLLLAADGPTRARLREQTTRELRRQRRRRHLASIAALLGVYAAGVLTVLAVRPPEMASHSPRPLATKTMPTSDSISDLEWKALDQPEQAATLYRTAGDRHLAEGDPANAVRCYGNALDAASSEPTEFQEEDNWLLMAIKLARRKEAETCGR